MKTGCLIINSGYPERQDYVKKIEQFFKGTNIIYKQLDGVFTDQILYDARFLDDNRPLTRGQIGCALAHVNALKTAIDMDFDYVYIFEDDVEITNNTSYELLQNWLEQLPNHDVCLITNCGTFQGIGHDGRLHKNTHAISANTHAPANMYTTCPFGTQSYYISKNIIKLLYETQMNMINKNRIFIADGLHIHCEKNPNEYLTIVTPVNNATFFKPSPEEKSIIEIVSK